MCDECRHDCGRRERHVQPSVVFFARVLACARWVITVCVNVVVAIAVAAAVAVAPFAVSVGVGVVMIFVFSPALDVAVAIVGGDAAPLNAQLESHHF